MHSASQKGLNKAVLILIILVQSLVHQLVLTYLVPFLCRVGYIYDVFSNFVRALA